MSVFVSVRRSPLQRHIPIVKGGFIGDYIGDILIMEKKMETTIWGLGFRV